MNRRPTDYDSVALTSVLCYAAQSLIQPKGDLLPPFEPLFSKWKFGQNEVETSMVSGEFTSRRMFRENLKEYMELAETKPLRIQKCKRNSYLLMCDEYHEGVLNEIASIQKIWL